MFKHLLVPTDGSPLSSKAARAAVEFASAVDGQLTALSVAEPYPYSALAESAKSWMPLMINNGFH